MLNRRGAHPGISGSLWQLLFVLRDREGKMCLHCDLCQPSTCLPGQVCFVQRSSTLSSPVAAASSAVPLSWKLLAPTMENKSLPVTDSSRKSPLDRGKMTFYPWDSPNTSSPVVLTEKYPYIPPTKIFSRPYNPPHSHSHPQPSH